MLNIKVIVLDFDGVMLESTDIKAEAFGRLFTNYPDHIAEIIKYHLDNGGISRYIKFRYIFKNIIKRPYNQEIEDRLAKEFKKLTLDRIIKCPFVYGAVEYLEKYYRRLPFYIVSGIPDEELKEILSIRKLSKYFINVYGSSRSKQEWLRIIIREEKIDPKNLLFVGDALSDYRAGAAAKVNFIRRISNNGNIFPSNNTHKTIRNLCELSSITRSLLKG